jgi:quercetin dioxygenase-like cupin family protein
MIKVLLNIFACAAACSVIGSPRHALAQEKDILAGIPVSREIIKLATYPVNLDPELGVLTADLGAGKLHQSDLTLVEIPPGGRTPPDRHLAEEVIYIVSGEGYTSMWMRDGDKPQRYEWKAGDLLSPSLYAWHQHFNTSTDTPARYISMTSTPLTRNLFHNEEFVTASGFMFEDRWQIGVTRQPAYKRPDNIDMVAGHFLPDLPGRKLQGKEGSLGITIRTTGDMAGNRILQTLVREYQGDDPLLPLDGHTHPWEVAYLALEGEGTTLLKNGDKPARLVNWEKGDLYIVEANEYHDNGGRVGTVPKPPYPRLMQMRPSGYFFGLGEHVGVEDHTPIRID